MKQKVIKYLTEKLGRVPTNAELLKILNGDGLINILEEIKKGK